MISISVSDLSYKIGEKVILDSVSFSLDAGDRLGIVGVNGAGKSTLLGMITSRLTPTEGSVYICLLYTSGKALYDLFVLLGENHERLLACSDIGKHLCHCLGLEFSSSDLVHDDHLAGRNL